MIEYMKEGEFVRAHDIYMLTAIGNAPWPIGLTMVGIHERSGREKVLHLNLTSECPCFTALVSSDATDWLLAFCTVIAVALSAALCTLKVMQLQPVTECILPLLTLLPRIVHLW